MCRIENGCAEEGSKIAQGSVSYFQVLSFRGKLIEHFAPIRIDVLLETQNIFEPNAPMSSDRSHIFQDSLEELHGFEPITFRL